MKRIKENVFVGRLYDGFKYNLEKAQDRLNKAVNAIRECEISMDSVSSIKEKITEGWLRKFIDEAKAQYMGETFIPSALKNRDNEVFEELFNKAESQASIIREILNEYHISLKMDSKGKVWFTESEVKEYLQKECTVIVPEQMRQYYTKIGELHEALDGVKAFEQENGLKPFSVDGFNHFTTTGAFVMHEDLISHLRKGMISNEDFADMMLRGVIGYKNT